MNMPPAKDQRWGDLERLLALALEDGPRRDSVPPGLVRAFAERAEVILDERIGRFEEQASQQEQTVAAQAETIRALEARTVWQAETIRGLEAKAAWQAETIAGLESQAKDLATQAAQASEAHERLREHHGDVLRRLRAGLRAVAALSPLRYRQARRRIEEILALLESADL